MALRFCIFVHRVDGSREYREMACETLYIFYTRVSIMVGVVSIEARHRLTHRGSEVRPVPIGVTPVIFYGRYHVDQRDSFRCDDVYLLGRYNYIGDYILYYESGLQVSIIRNRLAYRPCNDARFDVEYDYTFHGGRYLSNFVFSSTSPLINYSCRTLCKGLVAFHREVCIEG